MITRFINYLKDKSLPLLIFAAFFAIQPIMEMTGFAYTGVLTRIFIFALFAMSFDLVLGYTGLLNFGHTLFFGMGAYITGYTLNFLGFGYLVGLILGMLVCVGIAVGVSLLVSRAFHGIPFTFMSLAFMMIALFSFEKDIVPAKYSTGGGGGILVTTPDFFASFNTTIIAAGIGFGALLVLSWIGATFKFKDMEFNSPTKKMGLIIGLVVVSTVLIFAMYNGLSEIWVVEGSYERLIPNKYYFTVLVLAVSYFVMKRIVNSPVGHIWMSIRENETRAEVLGYRVFTYKMLALIVGGVFAGLAGGLYVPKITSLHPASVFAPFLNIDAIIFVILGGLGTLAGGIVGGGVVILFEEIMDPYIGNWSFVVIGIIFIIVVFLAPKGILGTARSERAREEVKQRIKSFINMIKR